MFNTDCFKAYDIRGKVGIEIDEELCYKIGLAYSMLFKPKAVVVGADNRISSEAFKKSLINGFVDSGVDVIDLGLTGTEEIYFSVSDLKVDGGIQITASHNPVDYNGMKLVTKQSRPISNDNGLLEIKKIIDEDLFIANTLSISGTLKKENNTNNYIEHLFSYINIKDLSPLTIVVNSGNGAAGHIIDQIERKFISDGVGVSFIKINNEPDGNFPKGIPNPLLPECRAETSAAVKKYKADLGIAFDGDFDRCFLFDENGCFIEGYYIVGLLAASFLMKFDNAKIIHDPRLYWNTVEIVSEHGGQSILSKTGHAYIKQKMREEDAVYGGEMSAHHYFRDFNYCDSGMIPWLLVLELITKTSNKLSYLVQEMINNYPVSGEINRIVDFPEEKIQQVINEFIGSAKEVDYIDGVSMDMGEWRFNLRLSNTESLLRLNVETKKDSVLLSNKVNEILNIIDR